MIIYKIKFHLYALIKRFFYSIYFGKSLSLGKNTTWRRRFNLWIEHNAKLVIGSSCFFNNDCSITCISKITIGDNTIFGENVKIYDHNHRFSEKTKFFAEQGYSIGEVYIGKNCWIGSNVVILKNAHIGDNCVIGAGVIVSATIPDNTILRNKNQVIEEKIR